MEVSGRTVADVADALRHAKRESRGATFFLGAGCSVTASIPAAGGVAEMIRREFPTAAGRVGSGGYAALMAAIPEGARLDLIARLVREARLNVAHLLLGWLVSQGYVNRILTTNFDNLVVRGCAMFNVYPAVYDVAATSGHLIPGLVRTPAVVHLHGQSTGFVQVHTQEQMERNEAGLLPFLKEANRGGPWVVIGYSGEKDPVFDSLRRLETFPHSLFWITYRDSRPEAPLAQFLDGMHGAHAVGGHSADTFFLALLRELKLPAPDIVVDPLARLALMLDEIGPLSPDDQYAGASLDVSAARKSVWDARDDARIRARQAARAGELDPTELARAFFEGRYQDVLADLPPRPSAGLGDAQRHTAAAGFNNWGADLGRQATNLPGPPATELLRDAAARFEQSHAYDPTEPTTLHNWGLALARLAGLVPSANSRALLEDAVIHLRDACERHASPDGTWHSSLASTLRELAVRLTDRATRRSLLHEAVGAYEAAIAAGPVAPGALEVNLAGALGDLATSTDEPVDRDRYLARAQEIMSATRAAGYEGGAAQNNWALLHFNQGRNTIGDSRMGFFTLADRASAAAVAREPQNPEFWENRGLILSETAHLSTVDRVKLFAAAIDCFRRSAVLAPARARVLHRWADAVTLRAERERGEARRESLLAARELLERARRLDPTYGMSSVLLAHTLADLAEGAAGEGAIELLRSAECLLDSVVAGAPRFDAARHERARILALEHPALSAEVRAERLQKALRLVRDLVADEPGVVAYRILLGAVLTQVASGGGLARDVAQRRQILRDARIELEAAAAIEETAIVQTFLADLASHEAELADTTAAKADRLRVAEKYYLKVLAGNPVDAATLVSVSAIEIRLYVAAEDDGAVERARAHLLRALEISPMDATALMNLACAAAVEGHADDCVRWLEKRLPVTPHLSRTMIDSERDFDRVRRSTPFVRFLDSLPAEQQPDLKDDE